MPAYRRKLEVIDFKALEQEQQGLAIFTLYRDIGFSQEMAMTHYAHNVQWFGLSPVQLYDKLLSYRMEQWAMKVPL